MRFNIQAIAAASFAALAATPSLAAVTPAEAIANLRIVTNKSQALQVPAQSISIVNGPLIIIGLGPFPQIIAGFSDIVVTATSAIGAMQGSAPVTSVADGTAIFNAFREFVRVHQVLLNILIGKAGLFNTLPIVGQPVAAALRQIESVVDTIAFSLIDMVQSQSSNLANEQNALRMTLNTAIVSYSGAQLTKRGIEFSA